VESLFDGLLNTLPARLEDVVRRMRLLKAQQKEMLGANGAGAEAPSQGHLRIWQMRDHDVVRCSL
jgi:hypothetical protein